MPRAIEPSKGPAHSARREPSAARIGDSRAVVAWGQEVEARGWARCRALGLRAMRRARTGVGELAIPSVHGQTRVGASVWLLLVVVSLGCRPLGSNDDRPRRAAQPQDAPSSEGAGYGVAGNEHAGTVDSAPDWDEIAQQTRQMVDPRLAVSPDQDLRVACEAMLDAAGEFYSAVESDAGARADIEKELAQTRDADLRGCERELTSRAVACVTVLLSDRDSELSWLIDQCARAYPRT